jgi:predicted nucleic acid-binding protein
MFKTTKTIVIVTPSRIEFLGGTIKSELRLAEFFLDQFELLDQGHVIDDDWTQAERLAKRVLQAGKHKHLGDCLIKAIALRLNAEVKTHDKGFPR